MKIFVPIIAAACLAAGSIGCSSDKQIVAPPASTNQQPPTAPTAVAGFPALTHPGTIYGEQGEVYSFFSPSQGSLISRYVIYDDGSFELEFVSGKFGYFSYRGTYTASGTGLTLNFSDSNSAGPWLGTAALSDDQMNVKYNVIMMLADFVDGVYVRVRPQ